MSLLTNEQYQKQREAFIASFKDNNQELLENAVANFTMEVPFEVVSVKDFVKYYQGA